MATLKELTLPPGFTDIGVDLVSDQTHLGRIGRWQIVENEEFCIWEFNVTYRRSVMAGTPDAIKFDDVYSFFLVCRSSAFLVDIPIDHDESQMNGSGVVEEATTGDGVWRLFKYYAVGGSDSYRQPITRPVADSLTLTGAAEGGTVDPDTGIVTGITEAGLWSGRFLHPMIFAPSDRGARLRLTVDAAGTLQAVGITLQDQIELL